MPVLLHVYPTVHESRSWLTNNFTAEERTQDTDRIADLEAQPEWNEESAEERTQAKDRRIAELEAQLEIKVYIIVHTSFSNVLFCHDHPLFLFQNKMLGLLFNPDQIQSLESRWDNENSSETISKSLNVWVATGVSGYEYLRKGMRPRCSFCIITFTFAENKVLTFQKYLYTIQRWNSPCPAIAPSPGTWKALNSNQESKWTFWMMAVKLQNLPPSGRLAVLKVKMYRW